MARKRVRIVDAQIDGGEINSDATSGESWIDIEDGTGLTADEVSRPKPRKARGPKAATAALFAAAYHYERYGAGVDVKRSLRDLVQDIGNHAVKYGLEGCELIDPGNGSHTALLGHLIKALESTLPL